VWINQVAAVAPQWNSAWPLIEQDQLLQIAVSEDAWLNPVYPVAPGWNLYLSLPDADYPPQISVDEFFGVVGSFQDVAWNLQNQQRDVEFAPQPALTIVDDVAWAIPSQQPVFQWNSQPQPIDADYAPQAAPQISVSDDVWQGPSQTIAVSPNLQTPIVDGDFVPSSVASQVDEVYWQSLVPFSDSPWNIQPVVDEEVLVQYVAPQFCPEEDYWFDQTVFWYGRNTFFYPWQEENAIFITPIPPSTGVIFCGRMLASNQVLSAGGSMQNAMEVVECSAYSNLVSLGGEVVGMIKSKGFIVWSGIDVQGCKAQGQILCLGWSVFTAEVCI
jgi:hypothetical protein